MLKWLYQYTIGWPDVRDQLRVRHSRESLAKHGVEAALEWRAVPDCAAR